MAETVQTPRPAFVIKTFKLGADGKPTEDKVFINVCALEAVERPITRSGQPVPDDILNSMGLDNAQVPIHVGPVWEDRDHKGETCTVTDVVFHPCVTERCQKDGGLKVHYQKRVAELAMTFVEEEHTEKGLKLCRQFKLPKMTYKGKDKPKPVVAYADRKPMKAKVTKTTDAEEQKKMEKGPLVQEIKPEEEEPVMEISGGAASAKATGKPAPKEPKKAVKKEPVLKKGFFNDSKTPLYPKGSEEGVLPENAGDPFGYLPKSLRKNCKFVDPTGQYQQEDGPNVKAYKERQAKQTEAREEFQNMLHQATPPPPPATLPPPPLQHRQRRTRARNLPSQ